MITIGCVPILRDLSYIETELGANMSLRVIRIGDLVAKLLPQFRKLQRYRPIYGGMPNVVSRVVRQRSEGKSVFVEVRGFVDEIDDEIAAAHVMSKIAEVLVAERVVAHVLHQRAAVGKSMCLFQIIPGCCRKTLQEKWLDVVFPEQVDDFFMREDGISAANLRQASDENDAEHRLPIVWESFHAECCQTDSTTLGRNVLVAKNGPRLAAKNKCATTKKRSR